MSKWSMYIRHISSKRLLHAFLPAILALILSLLISGISYGAGTELIVIGNAGSSSAHVRVLMAGQLKGEYDVPPNGFTAAEFPRAAPAEAPVSVVSDNGVPLVVSQNAYFTGGYSETMAAAAAELAARNYFAWYDNNAADGMNQDVILISNAGAAETNVDIYLGIDPSPAATLGPIPAGGHTEWRAPATVTDGPIEVVSTSQQLLVVSQRVSYKEGLAEWFAVPRAQLDSRYFFSWYDNSSPGIKNWILVGNPRGAAGIFFEIRVGGTIVKTGGPIPGGQVAVSVFPGLMGGPVEVRTFADAGHSTPAVSITSQRIIFQDSFSEIAGMPAAKMESDYFFPWYNASDSHEWILAGNLGVESAAIQVYIGGELKGSYSVPPGGSITPLFPGLVGGPVRVTATNGQPLLVTQRRLRQGDFSEVLGVPRGRLDSLYYLSSYPACDALPPSLTFNPERAYWRNLSDYLGRRLSIDFGAGNSGSSNAYNAAVTGSGATNNVSLISAMPVSLGDMPAGASVKVTLMYHVPVGGDSFETTSSLEAADKCSYSHSFSFKSAHRAPLLPPSSLSLP